MEPATRRAAWGEKTRTWREKPTWARHGYRTRTTRGAIPPQNHKAASAALTKDEPMAPHINES